ncbi:MAG: hypothetical protein ABJD11_05310 [Gemmatimonadota bacterium]
MTEVRKRSKFTGIIKNLLLTLTITVGFFVVIEGLASSGLLVYRLFKTTHQPLRERVSTRYDPELGWVAIPNLKVPDMYGPGIYLQTNAQGFRGTEDITAAAPADRVRAICSGDSFTLGFGVDNEQNWCRLLSKNDPRLQTVNMGQGGYGVDQAYLWYRRDGRNLEHAVQIFAYITDDFDRMRRREFLRYGKPVMAIDAGKLVTRNVPVPRSAFVFPWLTQNGHLFLELRSVELGSMLLNRLTPAPKPTALGSRMTLEESRQIVLKILDELAAMNAARHSTLALVHLPTEPDYESNQMTDEWRKFVRDAAAERSIAFIDLVEDFRQLPKESIHALFLQEGDLTVGIARGHYTVEGNRVIARLLYERLVALPPVQARLAALASFPPSPPTPSR